MFQGLNKKWRGKWRHVNKDVKPESHDKDKEVQQDEPKNEPLDPMDFIDADDRDDHDDDDDNMAPTGSNLMIVKYTVKLPNLEHPKNITVTSLCLPILDYFEFYVEDKKYS